MVVVKALADALLKIDPNVNLLIRPYPHAHAFDEYKELLDLPNIEFDNVHFEGQQMSYRPDDANEKYQKISAAEIFVHMGSTIGLESSYLKTPVIHLVLDDLDFGRNENDQQHISYTVNQRHLQKYMLSTASPNVIRSSKDLVSTIAAALEQPSKFLAYNRELSKITELLPMCKIANRITQEIRSTITV